MKKCAGCDVIKPIEQFEKFRRGKRTELAKCEHCREVGRQWYLENRTKIITNVSVWQKKNKLARVSYMANYMAALREDVFIKLGHVCARCGFSDKRALQIDHVNGDGFLELRGGGRTSGYSYLKRVLADRSGRYQILCANCNWIKRHEQGEQPHKRIINYGGEDMIPKPETAV